MRNYSISYVPEACRSHRGNHHYHCILRDCDVNQHFKELTPENNLNQDEIWKAGIQRHEKFSETLPKGHDLLRKEFKVLHKKEDVVFRGSVDAITLCQKKWLCFWELKGTKRFKTFKQAQDNLAQLGGYIKAWQGMIEYAEYKKDVDIAYFMQELNNDCVEPNHKPGDRKGWAFVGANIQILIDLWEKREAKVIEFPDLYALEAGKRTLEHPLLYMDGTVLCESERYRGKDNNQPNLCVREHNEKCEFYQQQMINMNEMARNIPAKR